MEFLALGLALVAGVRPWQLAVLALALLAPAVLIPPILYVTVTGRRTGYDSMPLFCDVVAAELRSGSTLRSALVAASESVSIKPGITSEGSVGVGEIARAVARELPRVGPELEATVEAVARSGGASADLFDELSAHALADTEIAHEVRVATAPARATALFFLIAPLAFLVLQVARGSVSGLVAEPTQRITASIGGILFLTGLIWLMHLIWRTR